MLSLFPLRRIAGLAAIAAIVPLAQGSGGAGIHINDSPDPQQVTTAAGSLGLALQSAFTLLDDGGQVLRDFEIQNATFELGQDSFPAEITELEGPWSLVLVVDSSRTFGSLSASPTFKATKNLVADSIGAMPEGSSMALIKFDDQAPTLLEFTSDKEQLQAGVRGLTAKTFGSSCLNNALYEAANKLGGAPGRRAVIVFTASTDNCAARTPQEVVDLANQNGVQLYAAGLQGYTISEQELVSLSAATGGVSEFKDEGTLGFGLSNLMAVLGNQWSAKSTVYPSAGPQSATLKVNLDDGTALSSEPISFISSQDYIPPTEIHITGRVQPVGDGVLFNLDLIQPETIRQLNVNIISKDSGQSVLAQSLLQFSDVNTVPAVGLVPGLEYTLIVTAIDDSGSVLYEDNAEFTYEPPPSGLLITAVTVPTLDNPNLEVEVSAQNLQGVVKFRIWLADAESGALIEGMQTTVPLGDPLVLPGEDLDSGEYAVVVQALDSGDTVLAEAAPARASYSRPGAMASIRAFFSESPLAIAGLTGLFCLTIIGIGAVVWLVLPKGRTKPETVDLVMPDKRRQAPQVAVPAPAPPAPVPAAQAQVVAVAAEHSEAPPIRINMIKPASNPFSAGAQGSPLSVGRSSTNDVVLPLDSASGVSGTHLTITYVNGYFFVQDDKSSYGTSVDGSEIEQGRPVPLSEGAIIGLGPEIEVRFSIEDGS